MGDRLFSFDANLMLSDGAAPYVLSQATAVGGAAAVLDLGGPTGVASSLSVAAATDMARFEGSLVVTIASIVVTTGCTYRLTVQGSNDPTFPTTGVSENLGSLDFGHTASRDGQASVAKTTVAPSGSGNFFTGPAGSTFELMFTTDQGGLKYRYLRCWLAMSGSGASIQFTAFVGVLP